jgi:hypothetical protein
MKINYRKNLKFVTLLASALLIASASAAVYYTINMQSSVAITSAPIKFVEGSDWPYGSSMGANGTWVSLALKAYPNATLTYEQPLNISNVDPSKSHNFTISHVSITPDSGSADVGNFTFINFVIKDAAGNVQATFNYTTTGNSWNTPSPTSKLTLPANTQWTVYVETKAAAGALDGIEAHITMAVNVDVNVQE